MGSVGLETCPQTSLDVLWGLLLVQAEFGLQKREDVLRREADAETRTRDPIITSDVLYQLSYVGPARLDRAEV